MMYKRLYQKRKPKPKKETTTVEFSCMPRQLDHYVGILIPNKIVENLALSTRRRWKIAVSKNKLMLNNAAAKRRNHWSGPAWRSPSPRRNTYFSGR